MGSIRSIGSGKMMVEFFSTAISVSVCKKRSCRALGCEPSTLAACASCAEACNSPWAWIIFARFSRSASACFAIARCIVTGNSTSLISTAKQAEAEREKRAKIIHAQGELQASAQLAQAANVLGSQPATLQLRYLQTLTEIAVEKNSTIIFPLPLDLIEPLLGILRHQAGSADAT